MSHCYKQNTYTRTYVSETIIAIIEKISILNRDNLSTKWTEKLPQHISKMKSEF